MTWKDHWQTIYKLKFEDIDGNHWGMPLNPYKGKQQLGGMIFLSPEQCGG